jgi:hypothetical protein
MLVADGGPDGFEGIDLKLLLGRVELPQQAGGEKRPEERGAEEPLSRE